MLRDPVTLGLATACTWLAVVLSVTQILCHLRNYTEPLYQRYIIRIIFMVPFYGVTSWLSLMYREDAIYFDVPRDCYEAWVIYTFLSLCMAYVGGPGAVVVKSQGKEIAPSWLLMTCCWPPIKVDGFLLRKCKQGTLQFVILKPILAAFTLILFAFGMYEDGDWSSGYLYISILYNTSYTIALYYLLIFYVGCEELLEPFHPLVKIILIKSVIFLTFWQSIAISFFAGSFNDPTDAAALQDWIVCLEMLMSACCMWAAFPIKEYKIGGHTAGWRLSSFLHAISLQDVYSDIMHQFNPNYKTYVLYSDGGPSENVKQSKFRGGGGKKARKRASEGGGEAVSRGKPEPKRLTRATSGRRAVISATDEEGEEWRPPAEKGAAAFFGKPGSKKGLLGWLPAISEAERRQAVLVDSDSDAEYDEEDRHDTAMDHEMLANSSGESGDERSAHGSSRRVSGGGMDALGRSASRRRISGEYVSDEDDVELGAAGRSETAAERDARRRRAAAEMLMDPSKMFKKLGSTVREVGRALELPELVDSDDDDRLL